MESALSFLPLLILFAIGAPAIAIIALVRANALQKSVDQIPRLIARIYDLEQRLAALDSRSTALTASPGQAAFVAEVTPAPSTPQSAVPRSATAKSETGVESRFKVPFDVRVEAPVEVPRDLAPLTELLSPAAAEPPPSAAPPANQWPAPPPPSSTQSAAHPMLTPVVRPARKEGDVESLIAGRWLNLLGILAIVIAAVFFLKIAFDNDWIGPSARVAIGAVVGFAMFPLSDFLLHRGYGYFAESIVALGTAILYLSLWTGWHYYDLFSQTLAFGFMALITAAIAVIALVRDSQRIALLALIGGLLTPVLISTGENKETALFVYLAILAAGMLGVSWQRRWLALPPVLFAATLIYFWGWYGDFYEPAALSQTLFFATLFFAIFAVLPAERTIRHGDAGRIEITVALANSLQILAVIATILWPSHRTGLTFGLLSLAVVHVFIALGLPRIGAASGSTARILYGGLALMFATAAIPAFLDGQWITIAFAVEAFVLVWGGLRVRSTALRVAGLVIYPLLAMRLVAVNIDAADRLFFNARFLTFALCAASMLGSRLVALRSERDRPDLQPNPAEKNFYFVVLAGANLTLLVALSREVWDQFGRIQSPGFDQSLAQELAISILWIVYAGVLMAIGLIRKTAALRWQSLGLLGVAVAKVFLFDSSFLRLFYRIVSFLILGLVLVVVSFFYQRRTADNAPSRSSS
jgi:uncharacterized membrane protein